MYTEHNETKFKKLILFAIYRYLYKLNNTNVQHTFVRATSNEQNRSKSKKYLNYFEGIKKKNRYIAYVIDSRWKEQFSDK